MAITIGDTKRNQKRVNICDEMNDYIKDNLGGTYVGALGYQLSKRVNAGRNDDSQIAFGEPIWIWKK